MSEGQMSRDRTRILGARLRLGDPAALAEVLGALREHRGMAAPAARDLGIERKTLHNWLNSVPALREGREEIREMALAARFALRPPTKKEEASAPAEP